MPRVLREVVKTSRIASTRLVDALADEHRVERDCGQPIIDELTFEETGAVRVTVFWDRWHRVPDEVRSATILEAYEKVEGKEFRERIALVDGPTFPEAEEFGLLHYWIVPNPGKGNALTSQQCRDVMIAEGASTLADPRGILRFRSREEAERCVLRFVERIPGSEAVWSIVPDSVPIGDLDDR